MGQPLAQVSQGLTRKDVERKSQKELLQLIASRTGGVLVVSQAIEMMKTSGVFGNPLNASQSIYSIINRSKSEFIKIEPGKYRIASAPPERGKSARKRTSSGLQQAIKALKASDPSLTRDQVRDRLIHDKFDFAGKNIGSAVNMAWIRLGYAKKNEGQRLPMELPTN